MHKLQMSLAIMQFCVHVYLSKQSALPYLQCYSLYGILCSIMVEQSKVCVGLPLGWHINTVLDAAMQR